MNPAKRFRALIILFHAVLVGYGGGGVRADDTTPWTIIYGDTTSNIPKTRSWSGSSWSAEASSLDIGASPRWGLLKNSPVRNELIAAFADSNEDLNVMVWNGTAWGSQVEVSTTLVTVAERAFYVAYEQSSGDALLLYRVGSGATFYYRTWNGTSWSAEASVASMGAGSIKFVKMASKPASNEIMVVVLDNSNDVTAIVWDGNAFGNKVLLDANADISGSECLDAAYEKTSGRCMVCWATNATTIPRYRVWSGSAWLTAADMQDVGGNIKWLRLASDPVSNKIIAATLDGFADVNVSVWSGSAWGAAFECTDACSGSDRRACDVMFEGAGTRAIVMYGKSSQDRAYYRLYDGTNWSTESSGPDMTDPVSVVQASAAATGQDILWAIERKNNGALCAMRWNGSSIVNYTELAADLGGPNGNECYMLSDPVKSTLVPASIPYAHDFETVMGAEWSNAARTNNATYTYFAGRRHSTGLKLALSTTIGETYDMVFDLYTIDSWDGSSASPDGPDAFNIFVDGTTVFTKTFAFNDLTDGQTYPYPYDSKGNYGFTTSSGNDDAIYRKVEIVFTASASVSIITFSASLIGTSGSPIDDESWGIDNVSVRAAQFIDVSSTTSFAVSTTNAATAGSGLLWGDLDADGDLDAILGGNSTSRIMVNSGSSSYSFTASSFGGGASREQLALIDFDNDDDLDIWIAEATTSDAERLYVNSGAAAFSDGGNKGLTGPSTTEGAAAADVNGDGWCDVICFASNGNWIGHHQGGSSGTLVGTTAASYGMNDSGDAGTRGMSASGDIDNDGYTDFYFHYNSGKVFVSDGDGTYTENPHGISVATGTSDEVGAAWGDYDNDGDLDLFVARLDESCSGYIWRNDRNWGSGTGSFTNTTSSAGLNLNSGTDYTPDLPGTRSAAWGDCDNDGDLDLLIVGASGNHYLYENQGAGVFQRAGRGIQLTGTFADGVFVDYDNDGDLDAAMTRINGNAVLLNNRTNNTAYLKVRVIGAGSGRTNKAAIGTRVELWDSTGTTLLARRDVGVARGFGGTEPIWLHFGGVNPNSTYQVKVYFRSETITESVVPATTTTTIGTRTINQMLTVKEPGGVKVIRWNEVVNNAS